MIRPIVALLFLTVAVRAASPSPAGVVVVVNGDDPESVALGRHYLAARKIPEKNLIALSLPAEEQITWDTFVARVRNPLALRLAGTGLIEATVGKTPDAEGRIPLTVTKNNVDFLVLCRGVPLKIANDPVRLLAREATLVKQPQFAVNHASVDSELTLLPRPGTPLAGFVPSPWYNNLSPKAEHVLDVIKVARLDGPSARDANRLVDNAIEAEKKGLMGRAYVDKGGPHPKGDEWLTMTENLCKQAAFDLTVDTAPEIIPAGARFDAPALYFGWYSQHLAGAPAAPGFRFPPGAIAIHIHSFSAATLRDAANGWTGPLVARGVTATVGNVEEPYLELTHNPALFLMALLNGATAGEAAAYSSPALSWQTIFVGDPLYRPFLHDVPQQLADIDTRLDPSQVYAVLRAVRRIDAKGESAQSDALLAKAFTRLPLLPLAAEILDREIKAGKSVSFKTSVLAALPEDAGLVTETAGKLASAGRPSEATALLEAQLKLGVRLGTRAGDVARRLGNLALAAKLDGKA